TQSKGGRTGASHRPGRGPQPRGRYRALSKPLGGSAGDASGPPPRLGKETASASQQNLRICLCTALPPAGCPRRWRIVDKGTDVVVVRLGEVMLRERTGRGGLIHGGRRARSEFLPGADLHRFRHGVVESERVSRPDAAARGRRQASGDRRGGGRGAPALGP